MLPDPLSSQPRTPLSMPYLGELVAIMAVSVAIAYVFRRIRIVPIVGYILAGVIIGPHALALVPDQQLVSNLAEIGVILLLFTIGVELSLEKLARIRRFIFIGGGLQALLLIVVVQALMLALGVPWRTGLFTAFLVVLSSTAIVLKLLSDQGIVDTPAGQVSVALLVFQDLAMVGMVLLVPSLAGEGTVLQIIWAMTKAVVIVGFALVLASRAIPWLLERVAEARGQELFLLTVVALCFGTAWLTNLAGVSLALGAFLAGLVVSESRYRGYALSEILPLRTVFNALFFVSIGMLLDLEFVARNTALVFGTALLVYLLKVLATGTAVVILGYPIRIAAVSALALAQICETSFVLERVGAAAGLFPAGLEYTGEQTFIAVVVLLMMATPFSMRAAPALGALLEKTPLGRRHWDEKDHTEDLDRLENHVVVVGYGPAGQNVVASVRQASIPYAIIELNARAVSLLDGRGEPVVYGDAGRPHVLELAGIERAKDCAVAINDPSAARRVVELATFMNPTVEIVVRAPFTTDVRELRIAGASAVVSDEVESAAGITARVLESYQLPDQSVIDIESRIRASFYGGSAPGIGEQPSVSDDGLTVRQVPVRQGALADRATLEELALSRSHGLKVLSVRRDGERIDHPSEDFPLQAGDRLVVSGAADSFMRAAHLFRAQAGA